MKTAARMTVGCISSWMVVALLAPSIGLEVWLGMLGPLLVAVVTMRQVERTYARAPRDLTPFLIKAFGAKMVLFGGYVALVIGLSSLDPLPFIVSFTVYFICLHGLEALRLRSLFSTAATESHP